MSENTIKLVASKTVLAFERELYNRQVCEEKGQDYDEHRKNQFLARFIKEEMEMDLGPTW